MFTPPALTDAELSAIRVQHAHRFPQTARIRLSSQAGSVPIQLVIGIPTGAAKMPPGAVVSPAWNESVVSTLRREDSAGLAAQVARDCVLWPAPAVLEGIFAQWPALPNVIAPLALKKAGRGSVTAPLTTDTPPAPLAEQLAKRPRAVWRWVRPSRGDAFALVIDAPGYIPWQTFADAIKEPGGDKWQLVVDFVDTCCPFVCTAQGTAATLAEAIGPVPFAAIHLASEAAELGGAGADAELGE